MRQSNNNSILDLDNYKPTDANPVLNLREIERTLGNKFIIQYQNLQVPANLYIAQIKSSNLKFYVLEYDHSYNTDALKPFVIYFVDLLNPDEELSYSSYITNIHKTMNITGTEMVKLVIEINKKLGVKKATLYDGANITCPINGQKMDLSFFKLIQYGRTFYTNLGFEFVPDNNYFSSKFKSLHELHDKLDDTLNKIAKIKISDIKEQYENILKTIIKVIINQDYENLHVAILSDSYAARSPPETHFVANIKQKITQLYDASFAVLNILHNTDKIYLRDLLIDLFNDQYCTEYYYLQMYVIDDLTYSIQYHDTHIVRDFVELFGYLYLFRNRQYVYNF